MPPWEAETGYFLNLICLIDNTGRVRNVCACGGDLHECHSTASSIDVNVPSRFHDAYL